MMNEFNKFAVNSKETPGKNLYEYLCMRELIFVGTYVCNATVQVCYKKNGIYQDTECSIIFSVYLFLFLYTLYPRMVQN